MDEQQKGPPPLNGLHGEAAIRLIGMGDNWRRSIDRRSPGEDYLSQCLARAMAETAAREAAESRLLASGAPATRPVRSVSEGLRLAMSADAAAAPPPSPASSPHQGLYPAAGGFEWFRKFRDGQTAQLRAEVRLRLDLLPAGQRIRNLRSALGWTQRVAAVQLGISMRTVIRYERGPRRWLRLAPLQRLRQLESDHVEEIIAHLDHGGRVRT